MKYHNGIYIDIMVFDKIIDNEKERNRFKRGCIAYRKLLYSTAGAMCEKNIFKRIGYEILKIFPKDRVKAKFAEYRCKYNNINTPFVFSTATLENQHYCAKLFQFRQEAEFEGHMFLIPRDYDCFLSWCYGCDYMTPPPLEERQQRAPVSSIEFADE